MQPPTDDTARAPAPAPAGHWQWLPQTGEWAWLSPDGHWMWSAWTGQWVPFSPRPMSASGPASRPPPTRRQQWNDYQKWKLVAGLPVFVFLGLLALFMACGMWSLSRSAGHHPGSSSSNASAPAAATVMPGNRTGFTPSAIDRAYFSAVGFLGGHKRGLLVRWAMPVVHVTMRGSVTAADRKAMDRILRTVNGAIGRPHFEYSTADVEITIWFKDHNAYDSDIVPDSIGYTQPRYTYGGQYVSAEIRIDQATSAYGVRYETLAHEFGHAIGLADTHDTRFINELMYYQAGHATAFTGLDLIALRMLYDVRSVPGMTRAEAQRAWR